LGYFWDSKRNWGFQIKAWGEKLLGKKIGIYSPRGNWNPNLIFSIGGKGFPNFLQPGGPEPCGGFWEGPEFGI